MNVLILLVGSNPLPVYITARYLLDETSEIRKKEQVKFPCPDRIVFVYSSGKKQEGTEDFRTLIVESLEKDKSIKKLEYKKKYDIDLGTDMWEYNIIYSTLSEYLNYNLPDRVDSILLGYTGGTKTMSVAASKALEDYYRHVTRCHIDHKVNCGLLFLNPKKKTLEKTLFQPSGMPGRETSQEDLREYFNGKITFEDLFKLHGLKAPKTEEDKDGYQAKNSERFDKFLEFKQNGQDIYGFLGSKEFQDNLCKFENRKDVKRDKDKARSLIQSLLDEYGYKALDELEAQLSRPDKEWLYDFLASQWLEEAVQKEISELSKEYGISQVLRHVKPIEDKNANFRDFEVDVLALRGYETYLFTCTSDDGAGEEDKECGNEDGTDEKNKQKKNNKKGKTAYCKNKVFEGFMRANQIGGEHAHVVLVCLGSKTLGESLGKDMQLFEAARAFEYIGRDGLVSRDELRCRLCKLFSNS